VSRIGTERRASPALGLCVAICGVSAMLGPTASGEDFIYHAQPRDTLIGLARRLLLDPAHWHELQIRNHIVNPRRIPIGSLVHIPYEWLRTRTESASVAEIFGTVQVNGNNATKGDSLAQGSTVETGSDGSVTLDLADGSVVTLQKSSALELDQMLGITGVDAAHSIRLKLDSGRVETAVKPHRDVGRFEIITPVAVSAVRGTRFRDGYSGDGGLATTETLEGTVGVSASNESVPVAAGFGTRVEQDKPPLPPVALLPAPDLSGVPESNTEAELRVELRPLAGAREYRVQVSTDPEFHTVVADTLAKADVATIVGLRDGEYWMRARAIDELGIEGLDAVRRLTQHVLPNPPAPTAPAAGATVIGSQVAFAWTSADPDVRFTLQIARDPAFSLPLIERPLLDATSAEVDDAAPGQYFWRVAAVNERGEAGRWSDVQSYMQRPAIPTPDEPRLTGKELHLSWQAAPGQAYRLQIAHDADFKRIVLDHRLDGSALSIHKLFPGVYFARLQGIYPNGSESPFGPVRRFESPVPLWVKITTPLVIALSLIL
jgi:hypothetical protein